MGQCRTQLPHRVSGKTLTHVLEAGRVVDVEQVAVAVGGGVRVGVRGAGQVRQPLPRRDLRRLRALRAERGPFLRVLAAGVGSWAA